MKKFVNRFIHDENGAELIEFAIVIGIVALLVVPVLGLAMSSQAKVEDAQKQIDGLNINLGGPGVKQPSGGGSTTPPGNGIGGGTDGTP